MIGATMTDPTRTAGSAPPADWGRRAFVEQIMGLPVSLHLRAQDPDRADLAVAAQRVFSELREVDALFSTWRADSTLLRLQHGELEAGDLIDETVAEVVAACLLAEEATGGLFTAFRRGARHTVFDPSGLVKGWAAQRAARWLDVLPSVSYCLGAGGDLLVGHGPDLTGERAPVWRIGIEDPTDPARVSAVVDIRHGAVATSGTAARGAHLWAADGRALPGPVSATVTGPDLMWADVWATAACVDRDRAATLLNGFREGYRLELVPPRG